MWLLSHSWQEKGISTTCPVLSLSLSCSLSLCSVNKNISSDNVNCSTAVLNITHVSPPAILYLLIKADRQINQGVCVWSGGVCARTCTGVSMWPCGSNSRRVSHSASPFWGNDWQLSCLRGCRLIFVRSHLFDGGSEGLLCPGDSFLYDRPTALHGLTHSRATPVISLCRWNYVYINLHYVLSDHSISWAFIMVLIMHCRLLHHVIMLLLLQKQCSMNPQLDLQWWLLTWAPLLRKEDNIHTCNLFLCWAVVCFLMMHTYDLRIIYLKVYLSPLGCALRVYHHLSSASICPAEKDPRWENESLLMLLLF